MNTKVLLGHAQFHGAKRLVETRHRLYWTIALILLLWAAFSILAATVLRFLESPTNLVAQDTVWTRINFPSVVVCPEIYFPDYKIEDFLKHAKYPAGMNADTIRPIIQQLTAFYSPDTLYTVHELSRIQKFLEYNNLDVEEAGYLLTSSCEESILRCRFYEHDFDCSRIFHMEVAMYGICCVFNGRSLKRELKQKHVEKDLRTWMTDEVGAFDSLMLAINQSQYLGNIDFTYKWLVVQSNQLYIDGTKNGTAIPPAKEIWSSFHSEYLHITEDSHFLGDELRGCQVENKELNYFPVYNKEMCLVECSMERIMRRCKCLLPVHYRPPGIPLCPARSLPCARESLETFQKGDCDCPYSCDYQLEISDMQTYELYSNAATLDNFYDGLNFSQVTVARFFLRSHQTITFFRRPLFNFVDLFSQLGGVFNVFFGCSILSVFELLQLLYYSFKNRCNNSMDKQTKTLKRKKNNNFPFNICSQQNGRVGKRSRKKVRFNERNLIGSQFIELSLYQRVLFRTVTLYRNR